MATHDYSLANQSGASFRSDLNNCLSAILSTNSNSSAPSTTVAYMLWADTSNGVLKIRNSANNAWIELLQLDGTLTMEDGAEATPGLAFRDDLNTGIWSSAADTFNISTAGTERLELGAATVFNESGADVDFRIEGDSNANLFYVDAGNDRIGIGESSPGSLLHVKASDTGIAPHASSQICLEREGTNYLQFLTAETGTSGILFGDGSDVDVAKITYDHNVTKIQFSTETAVAVTIDGSQRVGIGTASPGELLEVSSSSSPTIRINNSDGSISADQVIGELEFKANDGSGDGAQVTGSIKSIAQAAFSGQGSPAHLVFSTNGVSGAGALAERLRITHDGNVKINDGDLVIGTAGHGIDFSAQTPSSATGATTTSEVLDHYEEGTWTPTWHAQYGTVTSYTHQHGTYTRIGRIVIATFDIKLSDKGDISGSYNYLTSLPFNHAGSRAGSAVVHYFANLGTAVSSLTYEAGGSSPTVLWLTGVAGTSSTGTSYIPASYITDTTNIYGTVIYRV